jgi:Fe-S-cluster-containing dehydrogenase component
MTEVAIKKADNKRLIIDLGKCDQCEGCGVSCGFGGEEGLGRPHGGLLQLGARLDPAIASKARSYIRPHGGLLQGAMMGLRERVTFMLLCRRCRVASCVLACPFDALERLEDGPDAGLIKRHNLRCVSCKSCAHACPFGTIYPEMLTFYDMPYESYCASCLGQIDSEPACVASCGRGALEYRVIDPAEADVHVLDEYVAARVRKWTRNETGNEIGNETVGGKGNGAGQEAAGEAPA